MPYKDPEKARESSRKRTKTWRERNPNYRNSSPEVLESARKSSREWYRRNAEEECQKKRAYRQGIRRELLEYYGGKCACCSEDIYEFLALDHINDDGNTQRKEAGSGYSFYLKVYKERPTDLQVLCHNCNMARGMYGRCPHKDR